MKIQDRNLTGAAAGEASRALDVQKTGTGRDSPSATHAGGDRVEFSGNLGALARAVSVDQDARTSRIQALTVQVQNGTYHPDSRAISQGMVAEALASR